MRTREPSIRPLTSFHHVIWDWNGTLLDDAWLCVEVMNGLLAARGLPVLTRESYREQFDFPVIDYYRRLGFDFDREPFEVVGTEFIETYERRRHESALQPGACEVLQEVRGSGVGQSVLSAYRQETLEELIGHFGLRRFFSGLVGLDNHYAHSKVENGVQWIGELGFPPAEVLMIGDSSHDHEVAEAMGVECWLLTNGHHAAAKLRALKVPVFDSLLELGVASGLWKTAPDGPAGRPDSGRDDLSL